MSRYAKQFLSFVLYGYKMYYFILVKTLLLSFYMSRYAKQFLSLVLYDYKMYYFILEKHKLQFCEKLCSKILHLRIKIHELYMVY